jgi:tetratricopeptide (TPR) repeat protein
MRPRTGTCGHTPRRRPARRAAPAGRGGAVAEDPGHAHTAGARPPRRTRPVNVEAHEAYIRGRYDWGRAHLHRSIEHFERAVAIDPDYALAHAGIADAQCRMFGAAVEMVPPTQAAPFARAAALKALELDDSLSEPHVSLSRVLLWYDRDPIGAEREVRRAIQLDSNSAMAHFISGLLFADLGRADEAVLALQRALQLDPVSSWNSAIAGFFLCELNQREAGRQQLGKAIELDPSFFLPWSLVGDRLLRREVPGSAGCGRGGHCVCPPACRWHGHTPGMPLRWPAVGPTCTLLDQLEDLCPANARARHRRAWITWASATTKRP